MRYLLIAMVILVSLPLSGAVIYEYDGAGRLTRVDYGDGKVIAYRYDNAGNLVGRSSATARRRRPVRRAEAVAPPRALAAVRPDSTREEGPSLNVVDGVASGDLLPRPVRSAAHASDLSSVLPPDESALHRDAGDSMIGVSIAISIGHDSPHSDP